MVSWNSTDGLRPVQAALPPFALDVAQAVGRIPELPPAVQNLEWLRLMTPEEIRVEGRPVYGILRTEEDRGYHRFFFPGGWDEISIGPGHAVCRFRLKAHRPAEAAPRPG